MKKKVKELLWNWWQQSKGEHVHMLTFSYAVPLLKIATKSSCFDPNTHACILYRIAIVLSSYHRFCIVWLGLVLFYVIIPVLSLPLSSSLSIRSVDVCYSNELEIYSFYVHIFVGICWILSWRCVFPIHFVNFHLFFFFRSLDTSAFFPQRTFLRMRYFLKWPICSIYIVCALRINQKMLHGHFLPFLSLCLSPCVENMIMRPLMAPLVSRFHFARIIHIMNVCEWVTDKKKSICSLSTPLFTLNSFVCCLVCIFSHYFRWSANVI